MPAPSPFRAQPIALPPILREEVPDLSVPCGGPGSGDLDLWMLPLPGLTRLEASLIPVVSEEERHGCARRTDATARYRCLLQRGAVRTLLSGYLGQPARELCFARTDGGKPHLATNGRAEGLRFNLSHTGDVLAVACVRGSEVGVDVEPFSNTHDSEAIALRYFHPREVAFLGTLGIETRRRQFFRWWTAKEALLKARGWGIGNQLSRLDLSTWINQPAAEIREEDGSVWFAAHLEDSSGYSVTAACDRPPARIHIRALATG